MLHYREATIHDAEKIALLHTQSWQIHYRGILRDEFLDNHVQENRLLLWRNRFQHPKPNQHVLVAEEAGILYGFTCVYAQADPLWGALLDNLHVLSPRKGQGIGTRLMQLAAQWVYTRDRESGMYLWVYKQNEKAIGFYQRIGGICQEEVTEENPGGGYGQILRYAWKDLPRLISLA